MSFYLAPASDPTDRYAAGYDGNAFPTRAAAEAEIEKLRRIDGEFCIDWIVVEASEPCELCGEPTPGGGECSECAAATRALGARS